MHFRCSLLLLISLSCLFCVMGGTCEMNVLPPPEAVLVGAWRISAQDPVQNNRVFVFDEVGRLTEIRTTIGPTTLIERNVHGTTRVEGAGVFIRTTGNLIFEGVLNDAGNAIDGSLRIETNIPFSNNTLITELGTATLTRE